jgi:hypothetical protein
MARSACALINYRGLNEVTRNNAYSLPRVDDTVDKMKDTES